MTFLELLHLARAARRSRTPRMGSDTRTREELAYVRAIEAHICPR